MQRVTTAANQSGDKDKSNRNIGGGAQQSQSSPGQLHYRTFNNMLIENSVRDNRKVNNFFQMRSPDPVSSSKPMTGNSKKLIKLHSTFYSGTKLGSPPPALKHVDNKVALLLNSTIGTPLSVSTFSGQA